MTTLSNKDLLSLGGKPSPQGWIFEGDLNISNRKLTRLPKLYKVGGSFYCSHNQLTSLLGCPQSVGGGFYCSKNQLTSLKHCPQSVCGDFDCSNNQLTSLKHCPQSIGGDFYCSHNQLTSLEHCPQSIGGSFSCDNNQFQFLQSKEFVTIENHLIFAHNEQFGVITKRFKNIAIITWLEDACNLPNVIEI